MALLRSGTRIYGNAKIDTVLDIDGQDAATSNVTGALKVAGGIGVKGNVFSTGNITALNANLGNLVIANYYQGTLTTNAQPNITSVGSLTSLTVTGNVTGNNATFSGNLIVNGNLVYANVSTINIKDPIIEQGGSVDGTPLTTDDLKDRGTLLHYYTSSPIDAFMGWDNSNGEFSFGSNVTVTNEVVTFNTLGNVRANVFLGNLSGSASTVTASNQPNITGVGTLGNLTVTSNISTSNIFGTIRTASQPDITSLGTLTSLTILGPTNLGPIANIRITGGGSGYVLSTDGTGNLSWALASAGTGNANISGSNTQIFFNDANSSSLGTSANLTFDKSSNTLSTTGLTATGTVNLGSISNVRITGGSADYVLKTDGAGNLSWTAQSVGTLSADVDAFTGDGSNVAFTLANTPAGENFTMVAVQGVLQPKTTYSLSGNVLTFSSAPPETAVIEVTTFGGSVVSGGGSSSPALTWNIASSNATMVANNGYFVDTTGGAKTMTLPSSATLGDTIRINDLAGSFATNNLTIARNGHKIQGIADNLLVDADQSSFGLVYSNSTYGWKVLEL
jgi:hypothetical protein